MQTPPFCGVPDIKHYVPAPHMIASNSGMRTDRIIRDSGTIRSGEQF